MIHCIYMYYVTNHYFIINLLNWQAVITTDQTLSILISKTQM